MSNAATSGIMWLELIAITVIEVETVLHKRLFVFLAVLLIAGLAGLPAFSQFARGPASGPTIVIPKGPATVKRPIQGKVVCLAAVPANAKAGAVAFFVDDKEVNRVDKRPYRFEWDSTQAAQGEHAAKWSAVDDLGNEIAAGSIILVTTSGNPASNPITPPDFRKFSSEKYKVEIEYPGSWTVKDQLSKVADRHSGGYWLVFSTDPVADAPQVVNLRHRMLQREHSAESFVKNTPYIAGWNRNEVNGRTVFTTTAGSREAKRVVHRAMILDRKHLWMMNCIDTSGKSPATSKEIFMRMANSLSPGTASKPQPRESETGE